MIVFRLVICYFYWSEISWRMVLTKPKICSDPAFQEFPRRVSFNSKVFTFVIVIWVVLAYITEVLAQRSPFFLFLSCFLDVGGAIPHARHPYDPWKSWYLVITLVFLLLRWRSYRLLLGDKFSVKCIQLTGSIAWEFKLPIASCLIVLLNDTNFIYLFSYVFLLLKLKGFIFNGF